MSQLMWPWKIDGQFYDGVDVGIVDCNGNEILGVSPQDGVDLDHWGERSLAIAHLVAAAPELLAVARKAILAATWKDAKHSGLFDEARAAIAKAEGLS